MIDQSGRKTWVFIHDGINSSVLCSGGPKPTLRVNDSLERLKTAVTVIIANSCRLRTAMKKAILAKSSGKTRHKPPVVLSQQSWQTALRSSSKKT